jgi:Ca2+/Na+ antiporter
MFADGLTVSGWLTSVPDVLGELTASYVSAFRQ